MRWGMRILDSWKKLQTWGDLGDSALVVTGRLPELPAIDAFDSESGAWTTINLKPPIRNLPKLHLRARMPHLYSSPASLASAHCYRERCPSAFIHSL